MILLISAAICIAIAVRLAFGELLGGRRSATASLARAAAYGRIDVAEVPRARRSLPLVDTLASVTVRLAPGRERGKTAAQLHAAGFGAVRPEIFLALKAAVAVGVGVVGIAVGVAASSGTTVLLLLVVGIAIGFIGPDLVLRARVKTRREAVLAELPNALDLIAVIVEAGLGLDAALARYAQTAEGALGDEMRLLVTELRIGTSRADVLKRLADRVPAPETKAFVRAIVQADQLGTSLSGTLRSLAKEVRYRRQAAAEETANKAPVKMLFPTVLCIFPVLFVVVLGPVVLNLAKALS